MLGSVTDADDAVQETWLRLSRDDRSDVENLGGWLTTVVARVSLNMLRSRRTRPEDELDEVHVPDPIISRAEGIDPEQEALLADSVGLAMLVVLEMLSPAERLAFVLHDMFAVPFDEIAPMVDRSPEAARQLASRARRRVRGEAPEPTADVARQREVVDAFFAAAARRRLRPARRGARPGRGAARGRRRGPPGRDRARPRRRGRRAPCDDFAHLRRYVRPALVNGVAGVVVAPRGRPFSVMAFTIIDGRIAAIDALADPERLSRLDLAVLD